MTDRPFVVLNERSIRALPSWLKAKRYNAWTYPHTDKHGYRFIGLSWDRKPHSDWSKSDRAGMVLVKDDSLYQRALEIVGKCAND